MNESNEKMIESNADHVLIFIVILQPLAVGTPVTQRPPHRPGRAVFPHPVPRLCSLSRKASALCEYPMLAGD